MRILLAFLMVSAAAAQEPEATPVSRPLSPVKLPEEPPAPLPPEALPEKPAPAPEVAEVVEPPRAVRPRSWSSYDLLLWWSKAQPLPALVTGSTNGTSPRLGAPGTVVLVGGSSLCNDVQAGFRFTMGWNPNPDGHGFEFSGLFLGTNVASARFVDNSQSRFMNIGRPYTDAFTGRPEALVVAGYGAGLGPDFTTNYGTVAIDVPAYGRDVGAVEVSTTTRVQGWELNLVRNLADAGEVAVTGIAGYRYFAVNEGLHVAQTSLSFPHPGVPPTVLWGVYDQFNARNNYHGGQIGLKIDAVQGRWLFTFSGKVAFGTNFETVNITGGSSATTAALPLPAVQPFNAGMLAVGTNSGRNLQSVFAVLPEARLNLGFRLGDHSHLFAGYDFFYLSNAVRPGDQVDLTVDPGRSPILSDEVRILAIGPARPRVPFARSDFWVQGLTLGLDCRY